jgi:hypothetical protein
MSTDYTLAYGTHATPEEGRCAMEWVSHLAGEPHGDQPACVSPVLRAFCVSLNDSLPDVSRQRLRRYLARTIGTADDGLDAARSWMAMDWLIRAYTPTWLAVAGLNEPADELAALQSVLDLSDLRIALTVLDHARREARAAWSGKLRGAGAGAWRATGRSAAREAAWDSAGAAAWAAARVAVGDIAGDRARALARATAGDAAAAAAREACAGVERADARTAAGAALAPFLDLLRESALALLDRMLPNHPLGQPAAAQAWELGGGAPSI